LMHRRSMPMWSALMIPQESSRNAGAPGVSSGLKIQAPGVEFEPTVAVALGSADTGCWLSEEYFKFPESSSGN